MSRALAALALAAVAATARAESPRSGSFELLAGQYLPNVDSEFPGTRGPWESSFGKKPGWMLRAGASRLLFSGFGSLEAGLQVGYFWKSGYGQIASSGGSSGDKTKFSMIPTSATLTYRFDWLADRYGIPFAPYGRAALDRYNWWTSGGDKKTSKSGATNGWSVAAGLAFLLDVIDRDMAREFDRDDGVNHTYLFFEARWTHADDFGARSSWTLADKGTSYSGGLLFVF